MMVKVTFGIPGVASLEADASELQRRLGDLTKPVVIVKRDEKGLAFDTGLEQSPGSPLVVWSLHCETHQLWYLDRRQKGTISIRSAKTGLVLAADRRVGNGTWVTMQEWSSKPWQRWFIRPSDEPRTVSIVSAVTDTGPKSMDVPNDADHLSHVQLWDSWDGSQQRFMLLRPQEV